MDMNNSKQAVISRWSLPKIGWKVSCYFYKPDSFDTYNNTIVFDVSFGCAKSAKNEKEAACYFGSALCAFCPALTLVVMDTLEECGIKLDVIKLPSWAQRYGINYNSIVHHDKIEIYTLVASWLVVLFKSDIQVIGNNSKSQMIHALAKKLGMDDDTLSTFKSESPPLYAKAIYNIFGSSNTLKQEVREYLTWLSKRPEKIALMANFVLETI